MVVTEVLVATRIVVAIVVIVGISYTAFTACSFAEHTSYSIANQNHQGHPKQHTYYQDLQQQGSDYTFNTDFTCLYLLEVKAKSVAVKEALFMYFLLKILKTHLMIEVMS